MNSISTFINRQRGYRQIDSTPSNSTASDDIHSANYGEAVALTACRRGSALQLGIELSKDPNAVFREFQSAKTGAMTTLLKVAAQEGHLKICSTLLDMGANIDCDRQQRGTALFIAAQKGLWEVVEHLLMRGADPNRARHDGYTPLHMAALGNHQRTVQQLLINGADPDRTCNDGCTPLHIACWINHPAVIEQLLISNADPNRAKDNGTTPLYTASQYGHNKIVELLLERGANVDGSCSNGDTPLFVASSNGHLETVNLLLAAGADPTKEWLARVTIKRSALLAARMEHHSEVTARLEAAIEERKSKKTQPPPG